MWGRATGPTFLMDFSLTAEQELVRDTAREFCEREVAPHARDWDRAEEIDRAIVAKLGEIGFLAGWELDTRLVLPRDGGARRRRLVGARDRLGQRRARRQDDQAVGHRRAGRGVGPEARLGRGARLLRADRARLRLRPGLAHDAGGARRRRLADQRLRRSSSRSARGRSVALVFARTGGEGARGLTCFLVPDRTRRASRRGRSRASSACARRTPASSSSSACACPTRRVSAPRAKASRSRCRRSTTGGSRSRPAASGSRGAASTPRSPTRRSEPSSASRSPASSSCRS